MIDQLRHFLKRTIGSSGLDPSFRYQFDGRRTEGRVGDEVWYFAYGANMHDGTFRKRRGIHPTEWRAGRLRGYRLRFNLDGRPIGKAAPANIQPDPAAEVWGVLYRLTRGDLSRLDSSENAPGRPYRHLWVEAEDVEGNPVPCIAYIADGKETDGRPSLRYITLLREGARAHGLPGHYVRFLENVRHAE